MRAFEADTRALMKLGGRSAALMPYRTHRRGSQLLSRNIMKDLFLILACLGAVPAFAAAPSSAVPWSTVDRAVSSWARSPAERMALTGYIDGVRDEAVWEYKTDLKRLTGGKVLTGDNVLTCPREPTARVIEQWLETPKVLAEYGHGSLLSAIDAYMTGWIESNCHEKGQ